MEAVTANFERKEIVIMKKGKSRFRRIVSFLLTVALVLTGGIGGNAVQAAKKDKKAAKVSSVKIINAEKKLRLQKGKKFRLKTSVKVKPNKSKYKKLKFTSSNRKVVLVNSKGLLKGLKEGTARITAASKINPKKKASITVSVTKDVLVTSISLNKTKIIVDEFNKDDIELKVKKILPANAKNKDINWSSSDEDVADVDDDGIVTTGDVGEAVIRAEADDKGGAFATCKVTVMENKDTGDDTATEEPAVPDQPNQPAVTEQPTLTPEDPEETDVPTEAPEDPEETDAPTEAPEDPTEKPTPSATARPTKKPQPTPDAYAPVGGGWQRLDLSTWSGSSENYLETGDQIVLSGNLFETIPLPKSMDKVGEKIEVLIRGSVPEGSDGFRYWLTDDYENGNTVTAQGHYSAFGEGIIEDPRDAYGELSGGLDVSAFNTGQFQVQRVLEYNQKESDSPAA